MTDLLRPAQDVMPVDIDERVPLLFDFTEMAGGRTPASPPTITCEAIGGEDEDAPTRLDGAPDITDLQVVQWVDGCLREVRYLIRCTWPMTDGYRPTQAIHLRCVRIGGGGE